MSTNAGAVIGATVGTTPDRERSFALLQEYTKSESLIKHALCVEAAVRGYAVRFGEPEELWAITGLLHDFDYEKHPDPTPEGHPFVGCKILAERGYPEEMITAILGHANYSGVPRESKLAKTLFACDELTGLVVASALVRPDKSLRTLNVKSIKGKMKDKAFARGVNRDDVRQGAEELGIELDLHIENVLESLRGIASKIGLGG